MTLFKPDDLPDASAIDYTPADLTKWDGTDPKRVKQALDRLAARETEGSGEVDAGDVGFTPSPSWTGNAETDPADVGAALDYLEPATRLALVEAWALDTAYELGKVVDYGGSLYRCQNAHTSSGSEAPGSEGGVDYWATVVEASTSSSANEVRNAWDAPNSYIGIAPAGTAESAESWGITRLTVASSGSVTTAYATGAWTDYLTLEYLPSV